jgi:hypothetical protein
MSYRLQIRLAAEADVAEAAQWYDQRQPGLGEKFVRVGGIVLGESRLAQAAFDHFGSVDSVDRPTREQAGPGCWEERRFGFFREFGL